MREGVGQITLFSQRAANWSWNPGGPYLIISNWTLQGCGAKPKCRPHPVPTSAKGGRWRTWSWARIREDSPQEASGDNGCGWEVEWQQQKHLLSLHNPRLWNLVGAKFYLLKSPKSLGVCLDPLGAVPFWHCKRTPHTEWLRLGIGKPQSSGPKPAHHLFLYKLRIIFTFSIVEKINQKKENISWEVKFYEIQISVFVNKVLWEHSHIHWPRYCLSVLSWHYSRVWLFATQTIWLTSLKYLLSNHLQNKFVHLS